MQLSPVDSYIQEPMTSSPESDQYESIVFNGKKTLICVVDGCGKMFRYKSDMDRHQAIHSDCRPFTCPYPDCGKTFKRSDALHSHVRIHLNRPSFGCHIEGCKAMFNTRSALHYHLLKHKGDRIYKCSFPGCERTFFTITHLKQHENAVSYHQRLRSLILLNNSIQNKNALTQQSFQNQPTSQEEWSGQTPRSFDLQKNGIESEGNSELEGAFMFENPDLYLNSIQSPAINNFFNAGQTESKQFNLGNNLAGAVEIFNNYQRGSIVPEKDLMNLMSLMEEENRNLKEKLNRMDQKGFDYLVGSPFGNQVFC